jgi:hypothetical protein
MGGPDPGQLVTQDQTFVNREKPEPEEPRRKLVSRWQNRVKRAKRHWRSQFKRMRENMEFCEGRQWPDMAKNEQRDDRYVANICIRHVLQRTAELYPNNPTMRAKTKPKLIATTWDGSSQSLMQAQQSMMMGAQTGMIDPNAMAVLHDAALVKQFDNMMERVGKTLEIDPKYADEHKPGGAIVLPASGDVVMGMRVEAPYPDPLINRPDLHTGGLTPKRTLRAIRPISWSFVAGPSLRAWMPICATWCWCANWLNSSP